MPRPLLRSHEDNLIDLNVLQGKLLRVNAVVNAVATGGGQVNNKTTLPRLTPFWNDPKAANVYVWK